MIWPKELIFSIFVIFYNHLHQDVNFGQFDPLAPTPWGTPLHHPPLHLQTCLSYPTIWKKVLNHEIIKDFKKFEVEGCHIIFSSFWAIFVNFGANGVSLGNADKPKLPIFHLRIGQRVLWLTANDFFAIHLNMGHATLPLSLKHYPRKNTLKQKTWIEIPNVTECPTSSCPLNGKRKNVNVLTK